MKKIIEIAKGMAIGIANVIPGVSGGTVAFIVGIYQQIIEAIATFVQRPLWALRSIWVYLIGIVLGVIFAVFGVSYLYDVAPVAISFLFIGLILGSVPRLFAQVHTDKLTMKDWVFFVVMMLLVAVIPFISGQAITTLPFQFNTVIILFFLGALDSITMIIPGVSGSMVLLLVGYYEVILDLVKNALVLSNFLMLTAFGLGAIVGLISAARFIRYLFQTKPNRMMSGILGLVVASPFPILSYISFQGVDFFIIIASFSLMMIGFLISYRLSNRTST